MAIESSPSRPFLVGALVLLAAPYLLNDFGNIYVHDPIPWLACDYGSRVVSLVSLGWLVHRGALGWSELSLQQEGGWRTALGGMVATLGGAVIDSDAIRNFLDDRNLWQFGTIPEIQPPWLHWFDCVFGIALVAVSEELVFRGAVPRIIRRLGGSPAVALLSSSAVFGLTHWSLGFATVVHAAIVGLVFGLCAPLSRSLWPVIAAHFAVDYMVFIQPG